MVNSEVRLTALAHGGGCGCKLAPSVLRDILAGMPAAAAFPDLLVGTETADDAAVYRLNDSQALVATTDFFIPVVDDPYDFGRIAATNALSDVYAMGGTPIMALALVGMPLGKLSAATVQRIVAGGASVCAAAGIPVAGGHSIDSPEPIYGLVALGLVHPDRVMRNSGGRAGDSLILTKGLGARRPHPATLFTTRAARLRSLAEGNTLADYLRFLANIVDAQAAAVAAVPLPALPSDEQIALATEHMMPPLGGQSLRGDAGFTSTLAWLMDHLDLAGAPEAARDAADSVRAMPDDERAILAADIMQGAYPIDRIAETLFVAAALQVHLSGQASQLDAASLQRSENGTCPACGGMPVSSLVVGWTQASKARYCSCALCATAWNHVRIKCIACGSTEGIAYYTIEGGDAAIGIETCTVCRSYIKHMQQHENQALDPVADDVATYALDLLAREQDFRRSSINPLFLTG